MEKTEQFGRKTCGLAPICNTSFFIEAIASLSKGSSFSIIHHICLVFNPFFPINFIQVC